MISRIKGEVLQKSDSDMVVDVNGVGFHVFAPAPLCAQTEIGEITILFTHLVVREDALILYAFESAEQREYFQLLLTVDGIGPRSALSIVSAISAQSAYQAIVSDNADVFFRISGIGKKTSQKIILNLKDKVSQFAGIAMATIPENVDVIVIEALTKLGYSLVEAQSAVAYIPSDAPKEIDERLRIALQYFST